MIATPAVGATPAVSEASASGSPYGAYPINYKQVVTAWLRTVVPAPANALIQWQTEPKPGDLPDPSGRRLYGYLVTFNLGSRNSAGADGKMEAHAALIHDGQVVAASGF